MPRFDTPDYSELSKDDDMKTIQDLREAKDNLQKEISNKIRKLELDYSISVRDVSTILDNSEAGSRRIYTFVDVQI